MPARNLMPEVTPRAIPLLQNRLYFSNRTGPAELVGIVEGLLRRALLGARLDHLTAFGDKVDVVRLGQ